MQSSAEQRPYTTIYITPREPLTINGVRRRTQHTCSAWSRMLCPARFVPSALTHNRCRPQLNIWLPQRLIGSHRAPPHTTTGSLWNLQEIASYFCYLLTVWRMVAADRDMEMVELERKMAEPSLTTAAIPGVNSTLTEMKSTMAVAKCIL